MGLADPSGPRQVQHLWFLINLAVYTLICWPLFAARNAVLAWLPGPRLLLLALIALSASAVVILKPHAAALTGDNYQFVFYLVFFAGGYLIGADHVRILDWVARRAWWLLATAVLLFAVKVVLLTIALLEDTATGQALAEGGWRPLGLTPPNAHIFSVVEAATAWLWCLAALGLAARFLNVPSAILSELNRAVFPFYVLHFPITLVGLAVAARVSAPWWLEFTCLLLLVYALTWIFWHVFDRMGAGAYLVGGKARRGKGDTA